MSQLPKTGVLGDGDGVSNQQGSDDFYGFKAYMPGDSLKQVDWRGFAKEQPLQTKVYQSNSDETHWVDWYALSSPDSEIRLSQLCDWTLQLASSHKTYGLRLPNKDIAPAHGDVHKHQILTALAMYGVKDV